MTITIEDNPLLRTGLLGGTLYFDLDMDRVSLHLRYTHYDLPTEYTLPAIYPDTLQKCVWINLLYYIAFKHDDMLTPLGVISQISQKVTKQIVSAAARMGLASKAGPVRSTSTHPGPPNSSPVPADWQLCRGGL